LVSLAAHLHDPDNLLGHGEQPGITVLLLHKGTAGLQLGDHHLPISAFDNGPISGEDVVIPATNIIGGADGVGAGWRMLMDQRAGGRAISLPASAVSAARTSAAAAGPYSMVRQQFGIPIGYMEGVTARIARIAALAYTMESARVFVCAAIDSGYEPPVLSAILKQQTTEVGRQLTNDGMDVMGGAGVMQGPNNILGGIYRGAPVNITVQGAVRCHPYALQTLDAIEADDVDAFRHAVLGWLGHSTANFGRLLLRSVTRGWSVRTPVRGATAQYYRKLGWAAARFAFLADLA